MEIYLVGGAVRDELLGRAVAERDWVVVGATPADLEARGFRAVGRDFPVFLHPETQEEHALARLERKVAPGYRGFTTDFAPTVTLEQDLARRDLTINAMARSADGRLIDPYGGRADLERRVLRHVSPAFIEDPVRILRVARFAARFAALGFEVAPETRSLMKQMVSAGEADALVAERVWRELERALGESTPRAALEVMRDCGALSVVLPEVAALFGVPQRAEWHPEIDTGEHLLLTLDVAAARQAPSTVRFALLAHDLGKALTPRSEWPRHHGHETRGLAVIERLCERLRIPQEHRELALLAARFHTHVHRGMELRGSTLLEMLEHADAFRRPDRFADFLEACECDARGRLGFADRPYPQRARVEAALAAARSVALDATERAGLAGAAIGARLRGKRLAAIEAAVPRATQSE
ncbi:MAG: multifunctional CCA addition/repair protein [Gammaproteobacteria bacterium]|jgi:tRNA nucleotidyltransferase (CCA-adding enzyme)|nr:multifunctional CCA addition/repair protein [Gammaproteobacteria bacterium]